MPARSLPSADLHHDPGLGPGLVSGNPAAQRPAAPAPLPTSTSDASPGFVAVTGGTGAGQMRLVLSSTSDTVTLDGGDAWSTTPDATSEYVAVRLGDEIWTVEDSRRTPSFLRE